MHGLNKENKEELEHCLIPNAPEFPRSHCHKTQVVYLSREKGASHQFNVYRRAARLLNFRMSQSPCVLV